MEKYIFFWCIKGKDECLCFEEAIEVENFFFGRRGKKKVYLFLYNGSYDKEMIEYKCFM